MISCTIAYLKSPDNLRVSAVIAEAGRMPTH